MRTRCGLVASDQQATDAALTGLVNSALHRLDLSEPSGWNWLYRPNGTFTYPANAESATFASMAGGGNEAIISKLGSVFIASPRIELVQVPLDQLRSDYDFGTLRGIPEMYATRGERLYLAPVPSEATALVFSYVCSEPDLVDGSDVPLMPVRFQEMIVEQAAVLFFRRANNLSMARAAAAELATLIGMARAAQRDHLGAGRIRIRESLGTSF